MKKVFLTFGDGGENFVAARNRIAAEARHTGQFDEVLAYSWADVAQAEVKESPLRKYKRGCGYWIWKPEIIYSTLSRMQDGDILVFCDAGDVLFDAPRQWRKFFDILDRHEIVCKRISSCNLHMCRKEMLETFGASSGICGRLCFQFESGTIFVKRTDFTLEFMKAWMQTMIKHPEIIPDVVSEGEYENQLPSFVANRYEQSVLTLLMQKCFSDETKKYKIKTVWEFHIGWWLFGNPCVETARLRGPGRFRFSIKARGIRLVYRVIWRMQQFLEKRGLCLFWEKGGHYGA